MKVSTASENPLPITPEMLQHIAVLVNPAAANGRGAAFWSEIREQFQRSFPGRDTQVIVTESREHSIELGATLEADLIVSVSGDGTVHDILQGLMRRKRDERPVLAIVPIGSGNDIARGLGVPPKPAAAIVGLASGTVRTIDVGHVSFGGSNGGEDDGGGNGDEADGEADGDGNGEAGGDDNADDGNGADDNGVDGGEASRYFFNTLSFGVDAAIAIKTNDLRKSRQHRGFFLYAEAAVGTVVRDLHAHTYDVTIDGARRQRELLICAVQNGPYYGGGFKIAPQANWRDGLLDVCMCGRVSPLPKALFYLMRIARGRHEGLPAITTCRARTLGFDFREKIAVQCDGEMLVGLHYEVDVLSAAVDVLVPEAGVPAAPQAPTVPSPQPPAAQ